ncbi:MAG TPA: GIY-YIG nuclease family protein [Candidatus Obscuribacterales bacterium]
MNILSQAPDKLQSHDIQGLDLSTLPSLSLSKKGELPRVPAIYFCISESDEILYIGRTINLASRWQQHHRYSQLQTMGQVKLAWLQVSSPAYLPDMEKALIMRYKPRLNRFSNKRIVRAKVEPEQGIAQSEIIQGAVSDTESTLATFRVDKTKWDTFKAYAGNASHVLNRLIDAYLAGEITLPETPNTATPMSMVMEESSRASEIVSLRIPNEMLDALDKLAELKYPSRRSEGKPNRSQVILDAVAAYVNALAEES